ncbi:MAG: hypothetical protein K6A93_07540 [Bacteroidaceae bacterium]|nr:hypothetical protein [Bacteroidaceae bacterium]
MNTRKFFGAVLLLLCTVTLQMSGQNANETLRQKYERLEKDADANPTDWQKQYAVAQMLIQKDSELHDQEKANKFYERIYHIVSDINDVVPDSVYNEGCYILMLNAMTKSDIEKTVFYADELIRHAKLKNDIQNSFYIGANALMAPIMIMLERSAGGLDKLLELRKIMEERNYNGVENTDAMLAFFYDQTYSEYREWVADKLMEVTIEGKPYVLIAMGDWNVGQPLMGWSVDKPDSKVVLVDENLKVYDNLHGAMQFNFSWDGQNTAIVKAENTTVRLITVTPERRQQMVEAYKKYLMK